MHLRHTLLLPHSDIFLLHRPFQVRRRGVSKRKHFTRAASRGVTTQRHRSVGAFNREPTITLLLCAERASGVRSVVIARYGASFYINTTSPFNYFLLFAYSIRCRLIHVPNFFCILANRPVRTESSAFGNVFEGHFVPQIHIAVTFVHAFRR